MNIYFKRKTAVMQKVAKVSQTISTEFIKYFDLISWVFTKTGLIQLESSLFTGHS